MANEIRIAFPTSQTIYAVVNDYSATPVEVWYPGGVVFEEKGTGSRTNADYAITLTEYGGFYVADFPTSITAGDYTFVLYLQAGASPANTDNIIGGSDISWTGTSESSTVAASASITAICNRAFYMLGGGLRNMRITSYSADTGKEAIMCRDLYPEVIGEYLEEFHWAHLLTWADCGDAIATVNEIEGAEWQYQFNLPSDCLWVICQSEEGDRTARYQFDLIQTILLTNSLTNTDGDSAYIQYVSAPDSGDELTLSSYQFREGLANKLAIAMAPTMNPDKLNSLIEQYQRLTLPSAKAVNQKQQYEEKPVLWDASARGVIEPYQMF